MRKIFLIKHPVVIVLLSVAMLMAACAPEVRKTTMLSGQFTQEAPDSVFIKVGDVLDTVAVVTNGCFNIEIPTVLTRISYLWFRNSEMGRKESQVFFVADGSNLTYVPETKKVLSSDKKGLQTRYADLNDWMDRLETEYEAKMEEIGDDEAAAEAYTEKIIRKANRYLLKTAKANRDNVLGAEALWGYNEEDPKAMLAILEILSPEMQEHPDIVSQKTSLGTTLKTEEGYPFVDFTVVQDPDNPETSTVKFSDYIGKGKYVLVDFWYANCRPCLDLMPTLIDIYNTYHGEQFDMLSVAVKDPPELSREAAIQMGIVWNQIINAKLAPIQVYGFDYVPYLILFGPDGTILKRGLSERQVKKAVKKALCQ